MFKYLTPTLTLLSGLLLSGVAAYYSVLGMTRIFVGGGLSIILLFSFLELSKIIATVSLKKHWNDSIGFIKPVLIVFIIFTMFITALGTYGYLSKASQQSSESVNVNSAKVVFLEESIKRDQSKLDNNNTQINQYNELMSRLIVKDIRTASTERKRIQSEISRLNRDSKTITVNIDTLNTQLLPYKTEVKKLEVEVGPLLFITKSLYGEDYKSHIDRVLAGLIILIVFIFDPFAITLLIMSQKSFELVKDELKKEIKSVEEFFNRTKTIAKNLDKEVEIKKDNISKHIVDTPTPITIEEKLPPPVENKVVEQPTPVLVQDEPLLATDATGDYLNLQPNSDLEEVPKLEWNDKFNNILDDSGRIKKQYREAPKR